MKAVDMAFIVGAPGDALVEFVQTTELALDVETTQRRAYVKSEVGSVGYFPARRRSRPSADDTPIRRTRRRATESQGVQNGVL